ncbi:MAG: 50S ribosomal protein L5 [Acidobacteria bacterium]|nr:MAG: 50S ribosomal protein L5 [Acidobacteriota bacterium]
MAKEKKGKEEGAPEQKKGKKQQGAAAPEGKQAAEQVKLKGPTPRLKERFRNEILPLLMSRNDYKNPMAVPRLRKIVLNMGVGEANRNIKVLDFAADELGKITGQKAVIRRARKAISSFKLREGMPIGATVTLRGDMMYEFLDRLISIALPRVRDFKGLSPDAFDGRGNYTLGLRDQLIFPEIDYAKVDKMRGLNVTFVTSARTDEEARTLLLHLGMPFRKN